MATTVETGVVADEGVTRVQPASRVTLADFEAYDCAQEGKVELVDGQVRVTPPAPLPHARLVRNLFRALDAHVIARGLGEVFGDGAGYPLPRIADTWRGPDVSFVRAGKLPEIMPLKGYPRVAPDLVVEVLSPSESFSDTSEKLDDLFAAGTELAWVVDPRRRVVTVLLAPDARRRVVREGETLDGAPVLPEFAMAVADVFAGVGRE